MPRSSLQAIFIRTTILRHMICEHSFAQQNSDPDQKHGVRPKRQIGSTIPLDRDIQRSTAEKYSLGVVGSARRMLYRDSGLIALPARSEECSRSEMAHFTLKHKLLAVQSSSLKAFDPKMPVLFSSRSVAEHKLDIWVD